MNDSTTSEPRSAAPVRRAPAGPTVVIGSTLFALGMLLLTLVFAPLSLLLLPLPFDRRYRVISQWARINLWWLEKTCGLRATVEGREHIPETPTLVMSKHQSAWETLALQTLFSPQVWVVKRELLRIPLFGWGLATLRPIAIDRRSGRQAVQQVVDQGLQRLEAAQWVVMFPEGTRVAPGERGRYRIGGGVLAEASGRPVLPVAHNAGEYWPRHGFLKRPGTIRMVIGPPIPSQGSSAAEIMARVEAWIEDTVAAISETGAKT